MYIFQNFFQKWPHLLFYLLETKKYSEMFLMPFYASGPFDIIKKNMLYKRLKYLYMCLKPFYGHLNG